MKSRQDYINHITMMRKHDPQYAAYANARYAKALPWLDLENLK